MITDSVFILFKKTDFNTIFKGVRFIVEGGFVAETGSPNFIDAGFL